MMDQPRKLLRCGILTLLVFGTVSAADQGVVEPKDVLRPFNGKDLSGFVVWVKGDGHQDSKGVFTVRDGMIRVSGEANGYLATEHAYRNYHFVVEYKWGKRVDGSGSVRNSGVLLHGVGPDGGARGVWMTSIECQLAQGCEGDLIVIRGNDEAGKTIPATITSDTALASDNHTRWKKGGTPSVYSGKQFWWSKHQPGFKERIDTRGENDVASPLGKWTKVESLCVDGRITIRINGETVNEAYDVFPAAGRILLQSEGNEIWFRNLEIRPVSKEN